MAKPNYSFEKRQKEIAKKKKKDKKRLDKMAKGAESGEPWNMMQLILAIVAGKTYL